MKKFLKFIGFLSGADPGRWEWSQKASEKYICSVPYIPTTRQQLWQRPEINVCRGGVHCSIVNMVTSEIVTWRNRNSVNQAVANRQMVSLEIELSKVLLICILKVSPAPTSIKFQHSPTQARLGNRMP